MKKQPTVDDLMRQFEERQKLNAPRAAKVLADRKRLKREVQLGDSQAHPGRYL